MKTQKVTGLILSSQPFFEKDKLITIFSPQLGKCRLLAKRANASKNSFLGRLEVTNDVIFQLFLGRSFMQITQCEINQSFSLIRTDLNKINYAFYFMDIILKSTSFEQHNAELYDLLKLSFIQLENNESIEVIKQWFHLKFLKIEGILAEKTTSLSDYDFQRQFSDYSHKVIRAPALIV